MLRVNGHGKVVKKYIEYMLFGKGLDLVELLMVYIFFKLFFVVAPNSSSIHKQH